MPQLLDYDSLTSFAQNNKGHYRLAKPFPHIIINDFGESGLVESCASAFPPGDDRRWFDYPSEDRTQKNKQVIWETEKMPDAIQKAITELQSGPFLNFLETLTGVSNLISDPFLYGGGMHQIKAGGMLEVHVDADFNPHLQLYRRVTVLWYLSHWQRKYGGSLELWKGNKTMDGESLLTREKSIQPEFNRMVIFTNSEFAYHGHPSPTVCPAHVVRNSLALFYYSAEPDRSYDKRNHHRARFLPLPMQVNDPIMTEFRRNRAELNGRPGN